MSHTPEQQPQAEKAPVATASNDVSSLAGDPVNNQSNNQSTTHFGYRQVDAQEKQQLVGEVFDSVAQKYDLMNDAMSLGIHRFWKYYTLLTADVRADMQVLDLASGTGDLALKMATKLSASLSDSPLTTHSGQPGRLVASDINPNMLNIAQQRLQNKGFIHAECIVANAEQLPFADNSFHLVTMAFGLRNVTDKAQALREIHRVLKPGGKVLVLEFSKPLTRPFAKLYDFYSFTVLPQLGQWIAGDADSYRYLVESIRMHPDQETLKTMFEQAGLSCCRYTNLTLGVVALHQGLKI